MKIAVLVVIIIVSIMLGNLFYDLIKYRVLH